MSFTKSTAIKKIEKQGVLLVFPILNRKGPDSLWNQFYPRKKMRWEWSEEGNDDVPKMWLLMKALSDCGNVVYSKWYQGRATFFSKKVFVALLRYSGATKPQEGLSRTAREIYEVLLDDSPLSTKELKKLTDLRGKTNEPAYTKACKELFSRFLIVAYGEVDDGAFPSLAVGATKVLFEDLWKEAQEMDFDSAKAVVEVYFPRPSLLRKFLDRVIN